MGLNRHQIDVLRQAHHVAFDTCFFVYYFENHLLYAERVDEIFDVLSGHGISMSISAILLTELLTGPYRDSRLEAAQQWLDFFQYSGIQVIPLSPKLAVDAAYLRARYALKTPDSIHLATAMGQSSDLFIGNDKSLKKVSEIPMLILSDL